jgi:predicted phosphodiesterase
MICNYCHDHQKENREVGKDLVLNPGAVQG